MFNTLDRITELRTERGLSLYQLAKRSRIAQSTMSTWYAKDIEPPISMVERICDVFGITLSDFFSKNAGLTITRLEEMRNRAGLTREELAKQSGISVDCIMDFESRKRDLSRANYRVVKSMANVLGCTTEEIVDE